MRTVKHYGYELSRREKELNASIIIQMNILLIIGKIWDTDVSNYILIVRATFSFSLICSSVSLLCCVERRSNNNNSTSPLR